MTTPDPSVSADTILFTDLVGFTEYTDACGDAAAVAVLDQQLALARSALADGSGRLVKELGDGLMFWFAHPQAGLRVAAAMLAAIGSARDRAGFALGVRMGMHCGEMTARGEDFVGQTVNVASRIADVAGPGELIVSEPVVTLLGGQSTGDRFRPVGPTRVKGVAAPIWLHRFVSQ